MVRHDPLKAHFLKGNSLGDVYKRCHDQPFTLRDIPINIPAGYRDYRTFGGQCHEAGFDAFMTGVSFIRMFGFIGKMAKSKEKSLIVYKCKVTVQKLHVRYLDQTHKRKFSQLKCLLQRHL